MRHTLARWLRRIADWLSPEEALVPPALLALARDAVRHVDSMPHTSAYKRALAFKLLRAAVPMLPRRDVGLAIELAVREVIPR